MAKITLTLYSDLCPASGAGFGSVIDTDVCYNDKGFPYIPARRLKGCLREAAEDIDNPEVKAIFGESGDAIGGSLRFSSNALLADDVTSQVCGLSPEQALDLFTYTRAGTEIDGGTVKAETLRFSRVVKQYVNGKRLAFATECEIDSQYEKAMQDICKALRNIGYKRNRGFGAVCCRFEASEPEIRLAFPELEDGKEYILPITIKNIVPLVLSGQNSDETESYISGTQVLGALAWMYQKDKDSDEFADLFLNGKLKFSNCVPGDMPAPLCYAKMKSGGNYRNLAQRPMRPNEKDQPKLLKKEYMALNGEVIESEQEIIYHHRTEQKPRGQDALLYMQTALSAGQKFHGTISGEGKYLKEIAVLLAKGTLRIGKSKTAQYATCKVEVGKVKDLPSPLKEIGPSEEIAVVLLSDVLLLENCAYTTDLHALLKEIGLGTDICGERTSLAYRTVSGYNGKWNLKKPHARAFKAGSVLVFKSTSAAKAEEFFIGQRIHEGFGRCKVMVIGDMPKAYKVKPEKPEAAENGTIKAQAIAYAKRNRLDDAVTSSQIGRALLMLEQSADWTDFLKRLYSIKTKSTRKELFGYILSRYLELPQFSQTLRMLDQPERWDEFLKRLSSFKASDYKAYWDTEFRWQKYRRKIEDAKGGSVK
jgi:CRISPR-associated protein Csx10